MTEKRKELRERAGRMEDFISSREKFDSADDYLKSHDGFMKLKHEFEDLGQEMASNPEYWDSLEMWAVEVYSDMGELSSDSIESANEDLELGKVEEFLQRMGPIGKDCGQLILDLGHFPDSVDGGTKGWRLAVTLTEPESRNLCIQIRERFKKAVEMEILKLRRIFLGFNIRLCDTSHQTHDDVTDLDTDFDPDFDIEDTDTIP